MFKVLNNQAAASFSLALLALITLLFSLDRPKAAPLHSITTSTWSIVAVDPDTGDVGVAAASCVPNLHIDAVAALVPDVGAAATQAQWSLTNRDRVYQLLQEGLSADKIVRLMSDSDVDPDTGIRQYGLVTIGKGEDTAAGFTGSRNPTWSGDIQDDAFAVSVQGNTLVSEAVVLDALEAFKEHDDQGPNTLPDRLMRALEAGSAAGGDARCNNEQVSQTASAAAILVARAPDDPYAASDIGITDEGSAQGPWLALSVAKPRFDSNAVVELRVKYDTWRAENLDLGKEPPVDQQVFSIISLLLLASALTVFVWVKRSKAQRQNQGLEQKGEHE